MSRPRRPPLQCVRQQGPRCTLAAATAAIISDDGRHRLRHAAADKVTRGAISSCLAARMRFAYTEATQAQRKTLASHLPAPRRPGAVPSSPPRPCAPVPDRRPDPCGCRRRPSSRRPDALSRVHLRLADRAGLRLLEPWVNAVPVEAVHARKAADLRRNGEREAVGALRVRRAGSLRRPSRKRGQAAQRAVFPFSRSSRHTEHCVSSAGAASSVITIWGAKTIDFKSAGGAGGTVVTVLPGLRDWIGATPHRVQLELALADALRRRVLVQGLQRTM